MLINVAIDEFLLYLEVEKIALTIHWLAMNMT